MNLSKLSKFDFIGRPKLRVVRLIPDDSGFGLGNSGFNFGLSISVCGCTAACVTNVARGPSSLCTFQATSIR
jgi:hypothetical protein